MKYLSVLIITIFVSLNLYSQETLKEGTHQGLYFTGGFGSGNISLAGNISGSFFF